MRHIMELLGAAEQANAAKASFEKADTGVKGLQLNHYIHWATHTPKDRSNGGLRNT